MKVDKETVEKLYLGDSLSDIEVRYLINTLTDLEETLICLGERFFLAQKEVSLQLMRVKGFAFHRRNENVRI